MRIAFCGPSGAGKSDAANYLMRTRGGIVLGFAESLKAEAYKYGWDGVKDERGRKFLQALGQVVRSYSPDYWADRVRDEVEGGRAIDHDHIYLDDLRFVNEVDILRALGFSIIYLDPHGLKDAQADWRKDPSETFDRHHADIQVRSDIGYTDELHANVDRAIAMIEEDAAVA